METRYVIKDAEGKSRSAFYLERGYAEKVLCNMLEADATYLFEQDCTEMEGLHVEEVQVVFLGRIGSSPVSKVFLRREKAKAWRDREDERVGGFSEAWFVEKEAE